MSFPLKINDAYWENFTINDEDLEYLFSFLFENEKPLEIEKLVEALINFRIAKEIKLDQEKQAKRGTSYLPKDTHHVGQELVFPALDWKGGKVLSIRAGINPAYSPFNVIKVALDDDTVLEFASGLEDHTLNDPYPINPSESESDEQKIIDEFGDKINKKLNIELIKNKELAKLGEQWFPKSMLIDFSQGHLNLAEAVLDMQLGGPIDTDKLLQEIDVDIKENPELIEFSFNYALQEDPRFDEVGTKGIFSWFLHRLEPEEVRNTPIYLRYLKEIDEPFELEQPDHDLIATIDDELISLNLESYQDNVKSSFALNFPHLQVGSIPLTPGIASIFPSAYESNRVKILLIDKDTNQEISCWVVRPNKYVFGLQKWYQDKELMSGSIINLEKSDDPGVVYIQAQKRRSNREWIKTVLVGADGGIVIALLKQAVSAGFAERLAISVPDPSAIEEIWKERVLKPKSLKSDIYKMMQELSKLNQQRHVHFLELYAAINIIRRCPPEPILHLLNKQQEFTHVGDYYYHLTETG